MADTTSRARFEVQQHANGQIYVSEEGEPRLHARINGRNDIEIQTGADGQITIDKLYGPLIFRLIRISMSVETCEYVIERQFGPTDEWREWCRIPGQLDSDFSD